VSERKCPQCGLPLGENARFCAACGSPLERQLGEHLTRRAAPWARLVIALGLAALVGGVSFLGVNLIREARRRADDRALERAKNVATIAAYAGYVRRHPHGAHVAEATELSWGLADQRMTEDAYEDFLREFPDHRRAEQARLRIRELQQAEAEFAKGRSFYLYGHEPEEMHRDTERCRVRYLRNPKVLMPPRRICLGIAYPSSQIFGIGPGFPRSGRAAYVNYLWDKRFDLPRGIITYQPALGIASDRTRPISLSVCEQVGTGDQAKMRELSNTLVVRWAKQ